MVSYYTFCFQSPWEHLYRQKVSEKQCFLCLRRGLYGTWNPWDFKPMEDNGLSAIGEAFYHGRFAYALISCSVYVVLLPALAIFHILSATFAWISGLIWWEANFLPHRSIYRSIYRLFTDSLPDGYQISRQMSLRLYLCPVMSANGPL